MVWASAVGSLSLYSLACFAGSPLSVWSLSVAGLALSVPIFFRGWRPEVYYEPAVVYVFVQSSGSLLSLVGIGLVTEYTWGLWRDISGFILVSGFLMKIGVFPFHFWPVRVFGFMSWLGIFMGLSLLKYYLYITLPVVSGVGHGYMKVSIMGSFIMGSVGVVNQIQLKALVSWISVVDGGWALLGKLTGLKTLLLYMGVNGSVLGSLCFFFYRHHMVGSLEEFGKLSSIVGGYVILFSYAGGVPLMGSAAKVAIVSAAVDNGLLAWASVGLASNVFVVFSVLCFASQSVVQSTRMVPLATWSDKVCVGWNVMGVLVVYMI